MDLWKRRLDAIALIWLVVALIVSMLSGMLFAAFPLTLAIMSPAIAWLAWSAYSSRGQGFDIRRFGMIVTFLIVVPLFFLLVLSLD